MTNKEIALAAMRALGHKNASELAGLITAGELTDTEIIDAEESVPAFDSGKDYTLYPTGFAVTDSDQVYGLLQPYNAANYPDMRPKDLRALWSLKHTKNPEKAKEYVAPSGTSGMYMKDECCVFAGAVYLSLTDDNAYSPGEYPQGWLVITL